MGTRKRIKNTSIRRKKRTTRRNKTVGIKRTIRGGKFVAAGSYGCIYRPALHCDHAELSAQDKLIPRVSKLMTYHSAYSEREEYKKMDKIDPQYAFHLPAPTICKPSLDQLQEWKSCTVKAVQKYVASVLRESEKLLQGEHIAEILASRANMKQGDLKTGSKRSDSKRSDSKRSDSKRGNSSHKKRSAVSKSYNSVALSPSVEDTPASNQSHLEPKTNEERANLKLLVMEDGGDDLKQLRPTLSSWSVKEIVPFLHECKALFVGIVKVGAKGYIMGDIKPNNILYKLDDEYDKDSLKGLDSTGKKLNFIDFGTLHNKRKFVHHLKGMQVSFFHNFPLESYYVRDEQSYIHKTVGMTEIRPHLIQTFHGVLDHIVDNSPTAIETDMLRDAFLGMVAHATNKSITYDTFCKEAREKFDVYQLGLVFLYLLKLFEAPLKQHKEDVFDELVLLAFDMMHPNMFQRMYEDEASAEYAKLVDRL